MKIGKKRICHLAVLCVLISMCLVSGCSIKSEDCTVTFNTCTNLNTNKIKERTVAKGEKVSKPNVYPSDEEYSNYLISGWYKDPEYTQEWDFNSDVVTEDIVLYAKWEKQYFVRYFTTIQKEPRHGIYVMEGEKAPKQDDLVPGYKVEGYYQDAGYSVPFDFSTVITQDTDIYMKMSEGLYWDGKSIVNNWLLEKATGDKSKIGSVKLEEKGNESYARVDFGYAEYADSRISVFPMLDMTGSQIVTITYKNLGNSPGFRIFWTVEYEDGTVSGQDGEDRTWDYGEVETKKNMSEDDEWATLTIDMGKLSIINGVSQWADGKKLNYFRLDSLYYAGMDKDYVDNVMLIKEISFEPGKDYQAKDSVKLTSDNIFDVMDAAKAQESVVQGYVFPKDRTVSTPMLGAKQYNMTDCATYFFPYGLKQGLVNYDFSDYQLDMSKNQVVRVRYKNEGHGTRLTLRYHTTDGKTGEKTLKMKTTMEAWAVLEYNMMTEKNWDGKLSSLDLVYNKKDADNVLSVANIRVNPFVATQLPGINFNDDKCAGFKTNDTCKILYDAASEASYVDMLQKEVKLQKNVKVDTDIYEKLEFTYSVPVRGIKQIELGYRIGSKWYTQKIKNVKRTSGFETKTFKLKGKGTVSAMYVKLSGCGKISMRSLSFTTDKEYSLDLSDGKYISDHFNNLWLVKYGISYDSVKGAAYLEGSATADARVMFYLGASGYMNNVTLDSTNKKVYVCYNNPGDAREATVQVFYAASDNMTGSGMAGDDKSVTETKGVATTAKLKGNMKDGEWAVAEFDFSSLGLFSPDRNATMVSFAPGGDIYLRSIVLQ